MKSDRLPHAGGCPSCGSPGPVGQPCPERVCTLTNVCFIPREEAAAALSQGPAQREPLVGHYVGDYLVIGRLGKGGFGKVLLGLQRPLLRLKAAVKLIEFDAADERTGRKILEKFENEAAALAILSSPNIVRLLQYGVFNDRPFMAMEYIAGSRTLHSEINRLAASERFLDLAVVRRVLEQVLDGLEAAHREDIIHRDIKPENIMLQEVVGDSWFVKLVDFGLAKVIAESRDTSMVLGTPHYMAPEQIEGRDLGPWTDLYAVGAIAFELMLGRRPFPGRDAQEILRCKLDARFDPVGNVPDFDLPAVAAEFLRKALHRSPAQRFRSTAEMRSGVARAFASLNNATALTSDLSQLLDSSEISEIRRQEEALAAARRRLDQDRQRLEAERAALASERTRIASERLGPPASVEYVAVGGTMILDDPRPRLAAPVDPAPSAPRTLAAGSGSELLTGRLGAPGPAASAPDSSPPKRRAALLMAGAALVVVVAAVAAFATLGGGPPTSEGPVVAQDSQVAPPPPAASSSATVAPQPTAVAATVQVPPTPVDHVATAVDARAAAADATAPPAANPEPKLPAPAIAAQLLIKTTPEGAQVVVDGAPLGTSPAAFATHVGSRHRVVVTAAGRAEQATDVEVTRASEELTLALPVAPRAPKRPPVAPGAADSPLEAADPPTKPVKAELKDF